MICITDFLTHIRLTMKLQEQMLKKICEKWQLTITEGKVIAFLYNNPQKDTAADITELRMLSKGNVSQAATGGQFTAFSLSVSGIFFGIVSGFCYALTAIFGKLVGEDSDPFVISTYSYLFAALFLAVFMRQWETPITFTIHIMWLGFLYALIPTAIGYLFYYQGVRQIHESSRVPVIASMETVMATVLGMLVLGEKLTVTRYLGIIIVMFSIVLMQQRKIVPDATAQNNSAM